MYHAEIFVKSWDSLGDDAATMKHELQHYPLDLSAPRAVVGAVHYCTTEHG
jgi:hypothetical protein